jgi:transposase
MEINSNDDISIKLAMLFESMCLGVKVTEVAKKYGYSRARFYQIKTAYEQKGTDGLIKRKRGPKNNSVRTDTINKQIIRHRFLDPAASAAVISQKLRQVGYNVSIRSVERTITELGLQKKTLLLKSGKKGK